jgi:hypothetical protein
MLTSILLLFLLFLSLAGWGMCFLYKIKVHPAFIPLFLFSSVTTVLFGAGLLHRMPLAANIIYYSGLKRSRLNLCCIPRCCSFP